MLPERIEHLADQPELAASWDAQVRARRADASVIISLLSYQDRREREALAEGLAFHERCAARDAAIRDAALVMQASEPVTSGILTAARRARLEMSSTWTAFTTGAIDTMKMRAIARAGLQLTLPADVERLDAAAVAAAQRLPSGALRSWLRRFLARVNPMEHAEQCARAREDRWVRVHHDDDAMSHLEARIPTPAAAAIERRLAAVARGLDTSIPHPAGAAPVDARTLDQRQADLLSAWLLDGRVHGAPVDAKIAIMIPEATLAGESDAPGISADRRWAIPADDARHLAAHGSHEWYDVRYRPVPASGSDGLGPTGDETDLLSVVYRGRFAPARLRDALTFRDGTCQASGCMVPAERCDLDHQLPYPVGETTGANMWALCRRHHRLKSHGHLSIPEKPDERVLPRRDPPQAVRMRWVESFHGSRVRTSLPRVAVDLIHEVTGRVRM